MAVPDPEDLFAQADLLVLPRQPGRPLQVAVRRAISACYYGLFHYLLAAAADEFVGRRYRGTWRYGLIYRSIDHRHQKDLCKTMQGSGAAQAVFSADARRFAVARLAALPVDERKAFLTMLCFRRRL